MSQNGSLYADTRNMYTIHIMLRREFALLPDLVQSVADRDEERAKTVTHHISLMNTILIHHHQAEDAVLWPPLLARAPKEIDPVVHLAEGHHKRIEALLGDVDVCLAAWGNGAVSEDGNALAESLRRLAVILFEHMSLEEQLVLPVVERHIFTSEWQEMERLAAVAIEPQDVPLVFGMAMYEGGEDIVPEPLRADLLQAAPQVYADYAKRVHGTRTPPRAKDVVIGTPYVGVAG